MFIGIKAGQYRGEVWGSRPARVTRVVEVSIHTTDPDVARAWVAAGLPIVAVVTDGSGAHPTRWNRIEKAEFGPRGGKNGGVMWGVWTDPDGVGIKRFETIW